MWTYPFCLICHGYPESQICFKPKFWGPYCLHIFQSEMKELNIWQKHIASSIILFLFPETQDSHDPESEEKWAHTQPSRTWCWTRLEDSDPKASCSKVIWKQKMDVAATSCGEITWVCEKRNVIVIINYNNISYHLLALIEFQVFYKRLCIPALEANSRGSVRVVSWFSGVAHLLFLIFLLAIFISASLILMHTHALS